MLRLGLLLLLLLPLGANDLIPKPRKIDLREGTLLVDVRTAVIAPKELADHAGVIAVALQKTTGFGHRIRTPRQVGQMRFERAIRLSLAKENDHLGSYRLQITPGGATLTAADPIALMHGAQTFANLLPVSSPPRQRALISAQTIIDWPESKRRIFHLDVGAHLFPTEALKSLIDWLSFHKINELHLQLNNDQGWRMESRKFPKLHRVGSVRPSTPPYGDRTGSDSTEYRGHYTREMLRELIAHADSRAVTIIPAFAITSEASAIIAAYPELGKEPVAVAHTWEPRQVGLLKNQDVLDFLDSLFAEVASIFPATEIRFEGPRSDFHGQLETLLKKHQRSLLVPDDFVTTDFSLYPRPAAEELLDSPEREAEGGFNPVSQVYQLTPAPAGAQATLRTQFVHDFEKLQYLVFPRLAAFAEATWRPPSQLNYDDFRNRLSALETRYRLFGVKASRPYDPPVAEARHGTVVTSSISSRETHPPELIYDGRADTFFWSRGGLKDGDHLTLEFPWPITGELGVATGYAGRSDTILDEGVLELSQDGRTWHTSAPLIAGEATARVAQATRFVRLRATAPQSTPLLLMEVLLSRPVLTPLHEESRDIKLPVTGKTLTLSFKADFREHPALRGEIEEARRFFFSEWVPLSQKIGVSHLPGTPREFALEPGEPGEMTGSEVQAWMTRRMIPWLQNYPVSSPLWFTSGFTALLLEDLPDEVDRSKFRDGGPQSAAFLAWVARKYGDRSLTAVSQDCRRSHYQPAIWKTLTGQSLEDLGLLYQESAKE